MRPQVPVMNESIQTFFSCSQIRSFLATAATYLELTKPRLTFLAVLTTLAGFYLGSSNPFDHSAFVNTLIGAFLVGGGANALNQFFEREADARMKRTENRPIPSARLTEEQVFNFGLIFSVVGVLYFAFFVNPLSSLIALAILVTYLVFYTPLKKKTEGAVFVGAIPGALPPVMGWAAARSSLDRGAWVLFFLLFLWQLPHFLAIAWMYREDYKKAGLKTLACRDERGEKTARQIMFYCTVLLGISFVPSLIGMTSPVYLVWALLGGLAFLGLSLCRSLWGPAIYAKRLFLASIIYLPVLIIAMLIHKI